jgi:hypothetical protein
MKGLLCFVLPILFQCTHGFVLPRFQSVNAGFHLRTEPMLPKRLTVEKCGSRATKSHIKLPRISSPFFYFSFQTQSVCSTLRRSTNTGYIGDAQPADNNVDTILNDVAYVRDSAGKEIQCFIDQLLSIDDKVYVRERFFGNFIKLTARVLLSGVHAWLPLRHSDRPRLLQ